MEESSNVLIQFGFIPFIITEVQWIFFFQNWVWAVSDYPMSLFFLDEC